MEIKTTFKFYEDEKNCFGWTHDFGENRVVTLDLKNFEVRVEENFRARKLVDKCQCTGKQGIYKNEICHVCGCSCITQSEQVFEFSFKNEDVLYPQWSVSHFFLNSQIKELIDESMPYFESLAKWAHACKESGTNPYKKSEIESSPAVQAINKLFEKYYKKICKIDVAVVTDDLNLSKDDVIGGVFDLPEAYSANNQSLVFELKSGRLTLTDDIIEDDGISSPCICWELPDNTTKLALAEFRDKAMPLFKDLVSARYHLTDLDETIEIIDLMFRNQIDILVKEIFFKHEHGLYVDSIEDLVKFMKEVSPSFKAEDDAEKITAKVIDAAKTRYVPISFSERDLLPTIKFLIGTLDENDLPWMPQFEEVDEECLAGLKETVRAFLPQPKQGGIWQRLSGWLSFLRDKILSKRTGMIGLR